MVFLKCCASDIHAQARNLRATHRDDVMSIGAEGYAEFNTISNRRMASFQITPVQNTQPHKESHLNDRCTGNEMPSRTKGDSSKRSASASPIDHPRPKKSRTVNSSNEDGDNDVAYTTGPTSRAPIETPSTPDPKSKKTKTPDINDADDDSDDLQIVEVRPVDPKSKRKVTTFPNSDPVKKRSKHVEVLASEEEEDVPRAKSSAVKKSDTRGKTATPSKARHIADEGSGKADGEPEEDEDEESSDSEKSADEDPEAAQKLAQANKDIRGACRTCKIAANKAFKIKHEQETSRLKKQHKLELKEQKEEQKAKADKALQRAKDKACEDKEAASQKHEDWKETTRKKYNNAIKDLRYRSEKDCEVLRKKSEGEKAKVRTATRERDDAEAKRKENEKRAAGEVKDAKEDLKAGELQLKEERKQMLRENREEIDQLKPEHSKVIKNHQKTIRDMEQRIVSIKVQLGRSETDLREVRVLYSAEKKHLLASRGDLAEARAQIQKAEKGLVDIERFAKNVEQRAQTDLARYQENAEEKLKAEKALHQLETNRVIDMQRENYVLKDAVRHQAQLYREKRAENEVLNARVGTLNARLKASNTQLEATQAELGIIAQLDGMGG